MKITLRALSAAAVRPAKDYKAKVVSETARKLRPEAAESYMRDLSKVITVTDLWRSAAGGLAAIAKGKGSRAPGYSGHNYGVSIDIGVSEALKTLGFKKKADLDAWMAKRNWWCWRLDGKRDIEEWHYDWNRGGYDKPSDRITDQALQRMLQELHGPDFVLKMGVKGKDEVQLALTKLGFYKGKIDGDHGPQTQAALGAFQRAWMPAVTPTFKAGVATQRVLAFVAADYEILPAL